MTVPGSSVSLGRLLDSRATTRPTSSRARCVARLLSRRRWGRGSAWCCSSSPSRFCARSSPSTSRARARISRSTTPIHTFGPLRRSGGGRTAVGRRTLEHLRRVAAAGSSGVASTGRPRRTRSRSARNSSAVWYRFAGFFASARMTTASSSGVHVGVQLRGRGRLLQHLLGRDGDGGVPEERRPPGDHLVQHARRASRCPSAPSTGWPCACSGDRYDGGAQHRGGLRRRLGPGVDPRDAEVDHLHLALAREHDVAGLMSRWMTPCACADASALADLLRDLDARPGMKRAAAVRKSASVRPSTNSMTMYCMPPSAPVSKTQTMFGWLSRAAACASRRNRSTKLASSANCGGRILIATVRSEHVSRPGRPSPCRRGRAAPRRGSGRRAPPRSIRSLLSRTSPRRLDDRLRDRRGHLAARRLAAKVTAVEHDHRDGDLRTARPRREAT